MTGSLYQYFSDDNRRLEELMDQAVANLDKIDHAAYDDFRQGLLQHISIEEKIVLPAIQQAQGGRPFPSAARLRLDHGALAALMVPPPSPQIIAAIKAILIDHNRIEESSRGLYQTCQQVVGENLGHLMEKVRTLPEIDITPTKSSPYVMEAIRRALMRAGYNLDSYIGS
jgi:hypothetical protein